MQVLGNKYIKWNSLCIALFLSCQCVNQIICTAFPAFYNIAGLQGMFYLVVVMMFIGMFYQKKIRINVWLLLYPVIILIYYGITNILYPKESAISLIPLFCYCILPFLLALLQHDVYQIIKYTLILTMPAIFFASKIFEHSYHGGITMGITYQFLPTVSAAVAYLLVYSKQESNRRKRIMYTILALVNFYYLYEMTFYGSRGPVLSVAILAIILLFFRDDKRYQATKGKKLFLCVILFAVVILVFGSDLVVAINEMLQRAGINIRVINKTAKLMATNNILNGRDKLFELSISGFWDSPIVGNGLDMFQSNTGYVYPHNFVLQFLYDCGLIFTVVLLATLVVRVVKIYKNSDFDVFIGFVFLFCISVIGSLFSGDIWEKYTFWFFFASIIRTRECWNRA